MEQFVLRSEASSLRSRMHYGGVGTSQSSSNPAPAGPEVSGHAGLNRDVKPAFR